jgi:hypothetical protein
MGSLFHVTEMAEAEVETEREAEGSGRKSVLTTEQCFQFSAGIFLRGLFTTLCHVTVQL